MRELHRGVSEGTNLSTTRQHVFLLQETDCRGWRRCTEMFVSYIPDESASLCYAVGVLSSQAKIPGAVVKVIPERQQSTKGVFFLIRFQRVSHKDVSAICPVVLLFLSTCPFMFVFYFSTKCVYVRRISCKDLKNMLSQVNYRVPNMRFLREKLPVTFLHLPQTTPIFHSFS